MQGKPVLFIVVWSKGSVLAWLSAIIFSSFLIFYVILQTMTDFGVLSSVQYVHSLYVIVEISRPMTEIKTLRNGQYVTKTYFFNLW